MTLMFTKLNGKSPDCHKNEYFRIIPLNRKCHYAISSAQAFILLKSFRRISYNCTHREIKRIHKSARTIQAQMYCHLETITYACRIRFK